MVNEGILKDKFDLEERTAKFGEMVIELCKKLPQDVISRPIINQLVRSSTSIGANYVEANGASSKKDFRNKIFICRKESQESKYWLRMLLKLSGGEKREIENLQNEAHELILIFAKITRSLDSEGNKN